MAHDAKTSIVVMRVWLIYLSSITVLGCLYSAYQLYIFKVLRRTITKTRGLFLKQKGGDTVNNNNGILLALVDAQRNTPARMPGLPRQVKNEETTF